MFAVGDVLVSDEVVDAPFSCNLAACRGACCVQGDFGAPLEEDECEWLESILPDVLPSLSVDARRVIDDEGPWERTGDGRYVTTCVGDAECVFVVFESGIAKCGIQMAYADGRVDRPKPISCHLFPIRISHYGDTQVLNYESIDICSPARTCGRRNEVNLATFLEEPLVRKYGQNWYDEFRDTVAERRRINKG